MGEAKRRGTYDERVAEARMKLAERDRLSREADVKRMAERKANQSRKVIVLKGSGRVSPLMLAAIMTAATSHTGG